MASSPRTRRRLVITALALGALGTAAIASGPVIAARPSAPVKPAPQRALAFATEFALNLSRSNFREGPIRLQIKNIGEDDHDVVISRPNGKVVARSRVIPSEGLGEVRVRLGPGRYRVWCSLTGHRAHGMETTIVVKKAPARRGRS